MQGDGLYYVCVHYRVDTLVLDVCLERFYVDILSIVDICLLLVVQKLFLCTLIVSVLVHLLSVGCNLLFCGLSFVCRRTCTIAVCMRFMLFFTVFRVIVSGAVILFVAQLVL